MNPLLIETVINLALKVGPEVFALIEQYRAAGITHVTTEQLAADLARLDDDVKAFDEA